MTETDDAPAADGPGGENVRLEWTPEAPRIDVGHLIADAFHAAEALGRPELVFLPDPETGQPIPAVKSREGVEIIGPEDFQRWRAAPEAIRGQAEFTRLQSLVDHANRFKGGHSALFAQDGAQPSLTAVLDYSEPDAPRWARHSGRYRFPLDESWKAWLAIDGQWLDVRQCAEFVEDRLGDIAQLEEGEELPEPMDRLAALAGYGAIAGPSRMLELSRGFAVHENSVVADIRRLATGEAQIMFRSEHTDETGAPLKIPGLFCIAIPVFRHGAFVRLAVRFRYNKTAAGLRLRFDLWRPDLVFDEAIRAAAEYAATETGLPLFYGQPENGQ